MTEPLRPRWKRVLRFLLTGVSGLVVVMIVVAGIYSWRGSRQWETAKRELIAKGEKLEFKDWVPPLVPDEQNFFADPLWKEVEGKLVTGKDGAVTFVHSVPRDERQLLPLDRKFTTEQVEHLEATYPDIVPQDFRSSARMLLIDTISAARNHDEAWRKEQAACALEILQPAEPMMAKIAELLKRPNARFPLDYGDGIYVWMPHLDTLISVGQTFSYRTRAEIQLGKGEAAGRDAVTMVKLSGVLRADPFLISSMMRWSMLGMTLNMIDLGIKAHVWSEEELAGLQAMLEKEDLLPGLLHSLEGERASLDSTIEQAGTKGYDCGKMRRRMDFAGFRNRPDWMAWTVQPSIDAYLFTFSRSDLAYVCQYIQYMLEAGRESSWRGIIALSFKKEPQELSSRTFRLTYFLAAEILPGFKGVVQRGAFTQDSVIQAQTACALERYYLAHHEYPQTLSELVPQYLVTVPLDILTLEPMRYERTASDIFKLWSIGWDGKDDGGKAVERGKLQENDWVWGTL